MDTRALRIGNNDQLETQVRTIWEAVLQVEHVGLRDDFVQLGGDSAGAACVCLALADELGREVPLAALFHYPTIEGFAAYLRNLLGSD